MIEFIRKYVISRKKDVPFLILISFLVTFVVSRAVVYLIIQGILPPQMFLYIKGVRVHHLSYGIFLLAGVGLYLLANPRASQYLGRTAIIYGTGLGLTFDEFGMWLRLKDDYWIRHSYDAVIIITLLLLNIAYFIPFWKRMAEKLKRRRYKVNANVKHDEGGF